MTSLARARISTGTHAEPQLRVRARSVRHGVIFPGTVRRSDRRGQARDRTGSAVSQVLIDAASTPSSTNRPRGLTRGCRARARGRQDRDTQDQSLSFAAPSDGRMRQPSAYRFEWLLPRFQPLASAVNSSLLCPTSSQRAPHSPHDGRRSLRCVVLQEVTIERDTGRTPSRARCRHADPRLRSRRRQEHRFIPPTR